MQERADIEGEGELVYKIEDKKIQILDRNDIWEELEYKLLDQLEDMIDSADTKAESRRSLSARDRALKKIRDQRSN